MNMHILANSYKSDVWMISPFGYGTSSGSGLWTGSMCTSPTYQAYSTLFDEVKLSSIQVRFNINRTLTGLVDATTDFLTCVDRHSNTNDLDNPMTFDQVAASSSCARTTFNGMATFSTSRSYNATDFMEKYTFFDASYSGNDVVAWYNADNNTGFCPVIYCALQSSLATSSSSRLVQVDVDITYNLVFRNPKNGMTISSKAVSDTKSVLPDLIEVNEEEDEDPPTQELPEEEEVSEPPAKRTATEETKTEDMKE